MTYSQIILNKGKEFSLLRFHPWVFSGAIAKKDQYLKDGDIVTFAPEVHIMYLAPKAL